LIRKSERKAVQRRWSLGAPGIALPKKRSGTLTLGTAYGGSKDLELIFCARRLPGVDCYSMKKERRLTEC
jgi:hypothetical protein